MCYCTANGVWFGVKGIEEGGVWHQMEDIYASEKGGQVVKGKGMSSGGCPVGWGIEEVRISEEKQRHGFL